MSIHATLYDAEGEDRSVDIRHEALGELSADRLLWVDLEAPTAEEVQVVESALGLAPGALHDASTDESTAGLFNRTGYLEVHLLVPEPSVPPVTLSGLSVLAGEQFLLTAHKSQSQLLEGLVADVRGETRVGAMEAVGLLAGILDRQLAAFKLAVDGLERRLDAIDELALHPRSKQDLIPEVLAVRRALGQLRRHLVAHRETYSALTRPEFVTVAESASAGEFAVLRDRFERAVESIEAVRDMVVASVDLFMMRTSQHTNDVMKTLTVVSVVLLPSVVIAGVMGMNFKVGIFERPETFWLVLGGMAALALATLGWARYRDWI